MSDLQSTYAQMVDNELLADMTVTDVDFVPGRAMLNKLGEDRLCRLAGLLEVYGGTVRLDTNVTDQPLIKERLSVITKFLEGEGIDTSGPVVVLGMPDACGMSADEAILIKQNEGTYKPKGGASGGGSGSPTPAGAGTSQAR